MPFCVVIEKAGKGGDSHSPLYERSVEGDVDAVFGHAADRSPERLSHAITHHRAASEGDHFALGRYCYSLPRRSPDSDPLGPIGLTGFDSTSPQHFAERPVHRQVGVATDRRGEVKVRPKAEGEMTRGFRRVARLLHGSEGRIVEKHLFGPTRRIPECAGDCPAIEKRPWRCSLVAKSSIEVTQSVEIAGRGWLMDTKDSRWFEAQKRFRNRSIAGKHGLFHRPVSRPTLSFSNVCRMAARIQNHFRLWQIEIKGSIGPAAAGQAVRHLSQCSLLLANFGFGNH